MQDKDTFFHKKRLIRIQGKYWDFQQPRVMGILNVTPDSFYDGGMYNEPAAMMNKLEIMLSEGADIIDLGCYSSRPGAENITEEEELTRMENALRIIRKRYPDIVISIDTFRSKVAKKAVVEYSADIINDISAGLLDPEMIPTVGKLQVPYIIMHMRGTPETMQRQTDYDDLIKEVIGHLARRAVLCRDHGINDVIIDPGFGFSKTQDQNFQLLCHLNALKMLEFPLLVGLSRKSMIYKTLDISVDESLNGTTALNMAALERGANILRVHDVKEAGQAVSLFLKLKQEGENYLKQ